MSVYQLKKPFIVLTLIACLPALVNGQQARPTRIFKASTPTAINDLDPGLIESELIEGTVDQLPTSKPAQTAQSFQSQPVQKLEPIQKQTSSRSNQNKNAFSNIVTGPITTGPSQQEKFSLQKSSRNRQNQIGSNQIPSQGTTNNRQPDFVQRNSAGMKTIPAPIGGTFETRVTPAIQTEITAPRSINVNQSARFSIKTQNIGQTNIHSVKLIATLPDHAKFVNSTPLPSNVSGQTYEFTLNSLAARSKQSVEIDVIPTAKLPLNIATQIQIESQQQLAVAVQQPVLDVVVTGPAAIQTGQTLKHVVTVKNIGDGVAEDVRIKPLLPQNLETITEPQKTLVPKLVPGQTVKFELASFARTAGDSNVVFQVSAAGIDSHEGSSTVRVIRPELGIQLLGPSQNYLGRDGVYSIEVTNTSEIAINDVQVVLEVPAGLKVNTISQKATIDKVKGTINWRFKKIEGSGQQTIQFRAKAVAEGNQICNVGVICEETGSKQMSLTTSISGRADLSMRLSDSGAPIGVGGKSELSIEISNIGTSVANQVAVQVELPGALMAVKQKGYTVDASGNFISFENTDIAAGGKKTFKFKVVAVSEGEHTVRGTAAIEGSSQRISSENTVFVFESQNAKVSEALVPGTRR